MLPIACLLVPILWFIGVHLRALTGADVCQLAQKRRKQAISSYFKFSRTLLKMTVEGKNRYSIDGSLVPCTEPLSTFPATIAALLKSKKHEWIIFGFEKDKKIVCFWINKGESKLKVAPKLTHEAIAGIAATLNCSSVVRLHNHPNSDPHNTNCLIPSKQDVISAEHLSKLLDKNGINLLDCICERGRFLHYYSFFSCQFMPERAFAADINAFNGKSKWGNLKLHWERMF